MNKQDQIVLFGAPAPLAANIASAVNITERYVTVKAKGPDGKFHVVKDKAGNPTYVKDRDGNPVVASVAIGLYPRKSAENTDLGEVTGFTGQALMTFEREARDLLCDQALAELQRLRASGGYTYAREHRNKRNGAITLTVKPVFGGRNLTTSADEEVVKELERRGYKVEKSPANGNGQAETPKAPAKGNGKSKKS
jgi:hypothetical protein